jgi:hypothetical protein
MNASFAGAGLPVDQKGFSSCLDKTHLGAPELWSVLAVETSGAGFDHLRRPKILFERHIFSQRTGGKYDSAHPDISNKVAGGYGDFDAQYARLQVALGLNRKAALESASWGIGQVMGFNAQAAGYPDAEQMVAAMAESESSQLMALANFLLANDLTKPLAQHDWAAFAKKYNGPDYKSHQYDDRLRSNYEKFKAGVMPDLMVRAAQQLLVYLGYFPGTVDGVSGRMTRSALHDFMQAESLPLSDTIDQPLLDGIIVKLDKLNKLG